jgi:beta-mannosidase
MVKGTYEHADTFVQRDVNPVGIWRAVKLILHDGVREDGPP